MIRVGGEWTPVVDCDVHETLPSIDVLRPRLPRTWQRYFTECGFSGLPNDPYVATAHGGARADSWPAGGGPPGSSLPFMQEQLLAEHGIDYAILVGHFFRVSYLPQAEFAVALASAYNDWLIEEWLAGDERLLGSLQLALQDPQAAAREIDRLGGHPQIVQVLFPSTAQRPYGDPSFDPVYQALERNGLIMAVHPSGSTGTAPPLSGIAGGWPRTYMEMHCNWSLAFQAQLTNMVCEGTFVKFPGLRVVLLEAGFHWLPHLRWTLDTHWQSLQPEVPWLTEKPSRAIRDHVYLGSQPTIVPENTEHFLQILEMIDAHSTLLYASDYPHWDFDAPTRALPREVPDDLRRRILGRNALELYGLPDPAPQGVEGQEVEVHGVEVHGVEVHGAEAAPA